MTSLLDKYRAYSHLQRPNIGQNIGQILGKHRKNMGKYWLKSDKYLCQYVGFGIDNISAKTTLFAKTCRCWEQGSRPSHGCRTPVTPAQGISTIWKWIIWKDQYHNHIQRRRSIFWKLRGEIVRMTWLCPMGNTHANLTF